MEENDGGQSGGEQEGASKASTESPLKQPGSTPTAPQQYQLPLPPVYGPSPSTPGHEQRQQGQQPSPYYSGGVAPGASPNHHPPLYYPYSVPYPPPPPPQPHSTPPGSAAKSSPTSSTPGPSNPSPQNQPVYWQHAPANNTSMEPSPHANYPPPMYYPGPPPPGYHHPHVMHAPIPQVYGQSYGSPEPQYVANGYAWPPPPPHGGRYMQPMYAWTQGGISSPNLPPQVAKSSSGPARSLKQSPSLKNDKAKDKDARREVRATSPSEIESTLRVEIQSMGCTCKKTACLKLYCQCFGVKIYCGMNCRCLDCMNTVEHDGKRREAIRTILSRNPAAFDGKFKKDAEEQKQEEQQAVSVAHRLGCKCRKSGCMKKYCECYAGNVRCSSGCRCMDCKNMGPNAVSNTSPVGFRDRRSNALKYRVPLQPFYHPLPPPRPRGRGRSPYSFPPPPPPPPQAPTQSSVGADSWAVAQSLTFLKRSSPNTKFGGVGVSPIIKSPQSNNGQDPSLASSPSGVENTNSAKKQKAPTPLSVDKSDNALLMAAVAMTEFGQTPPKLHSPLNRSQEDIATSKRNINFENDDDDDKKQKRVKVEETV